MSVSQDYLEFVRELLAGLGHLRIKRMFGAAGVYCDELFFAVADDEQLYIKADAETEPLFQEAGSEAFAFTGREGQVMTTHFWRLPETALDDPEEAVRWARLGLDVALRAASRRRKR